MTSNFRIWYHLWDCFYKRAFELCDLWRTWVLERMSGRLNVLLSIWLCVKFDVWVNILVCWESFDLTLKYQGLAIIFDAICSRMFSNSKNIKQYYLDCQIHDEYEHFTIVIINHILPFLIRLWEYPYIIGLAIALHIPIKWHAKTTIVTRDISFPNASGLESNIKLIVPNGNHNVR